MGSLTYSVNSTKPDVTEQNVRNATNNLYKNSPTFKYIMDTIFNHSSSPDVKVVVDDSHPKAQVHTPQTWAAEVGTPWPYGGTEYVVFVPTSAFDGEAYGPHKVNYERPLSHEMRHINYHQKNGSWPDKTAQPQDHINSEEDATKAEDFVSEEATKATPSTTDDEPAQLRGSYSNAPTPGSGEAPHFIDITPGAPEIPTTPQPDKPTPPGEEDAPEDEPPESFADTVWGALEDFYEWLKSLVSPLTIDLDGDGIELVSSTSYGAVYWDIDNDGYSEATGWVHPDDGLLAIDLNEDGIVTDQTELFGNTEIYANGFEALKAYDSNGDGIIDAQDADFSKLIVWQDINNDGYSQQDEMFSLTTLNITEIDLNYTNVDITNAGNKIYQESTATMNGVGVDIVDVWFAYNNMDTVYNEDYMIDLSTVHLPQIRGFGTMPSLTIAMSLDNDHQDPDSLISLVSELSTTDIADFFTSDDTIMNSVRDIMYRWAGVDDVNPLSRGPNVDARTLGFLEVLTGQDFLQRGHSSDPYYYAGQALDEAFATTQNYIYARLLAQTAGGELLDGEWIYDSARDTFSGITGLNTDVLDNLETQGLSEAIPEIFWANVVRMIEFTVGTANLSVSDLTALNSAIAASDPSLDLQDIVNGLDYSDPVITTYNGTAGDDVINGSNGQDTLNGGYGNDELYGGAEKDTLNGGDGDDQLYGGTWSDYLLGGSGNDTYYYDLGDGWDTIRESGTGASDKIVFGAGIDASDLTFSRGGNDLLIEIETGSQTAQILIENQFNYAAGGDHVETIVFSDASTLALDGQGYTAYGTDGNDSIVGTRSGSNSEDTIYGGDGHDTLTASAPNEQDYANNWLYGEAGNDTLNGGRGVDELYGGTGDDTINADQGNDHIWGGTGNDFAAGGLGDDIYYYTSGLDTYLESSTGSDEIRLDAAWNGYSPDYFRIGDDMSIEFDQDNKITIQDFFGHSTYDKIETMIFADTTSVDLTTVAFIEQGTSGDDYLTGTSGDDLMYGFAGNDVLGIGYGDGNDTLYGGTGDDVLDGGRHNDYLSGGSGNDTLNGLSGDDHYYYVSGQDVINEQNGDDILEIGAGWDYEDLQLARYATNFDNLVITLGTTGANSITINDHFYGDDYIDTLRMNDGSADISLTAISEYVAYGDESNNNIDGVINVNGRMNADTLYGYGGNDTLDGDDGDDILYGGTGNDTLNGGDYHDHLYGEEGDDVLEGGFGDDTFYYSEGHDTFEDTDGVDTIVMDAAWLQSDVTFMRYDTAQNDLIITFAGSSTDSITLDNHFSGNDVFESLYFAGEDITIDLTTYDYVTAGTAGNDSINGVRNYYFNGYAINDTLYGYEGNDTLNGEEGNDTLYGGLGDDLLRGDQGDDLFVYESGLDTFYERSSGNDTIWITNGVSIEDISFANTGSYDTSILITASTDEILLDNQRHGATQYHFENLRFDDGFETNLLTDYNNWNWGTTGADTLNGDSSDNMIIGNDGADTISAGDGDDDVHGGAGDDTLYGGIGSDLLYGSDGSDILYGDAGNDVLMGGLGLDTLTGGAAADTFKVLSNHLDSYVDTITDFDTLDGDAIDIADLLSLYDPLVDTLAEFVEITDDGTDSFLSVDVDGGGDSFVQILEMTGVTGLTDEATLVTSGNLIV